MSRSRRNTLALERQRRLHALVFAALGDETRLRIVTELGNGEPRSIAQLTEGSPLTRQAVTKHLRVLEDAGIVQGEWEGRECRYSLEPRPLLTLKEYLDQVSMQWENALLRLKSFVER